MWDGKYIEELIKLRETSVIGGGIERINKQHSCGKLTARERIDALLDPCSFNEVNAFVESIAVDFGMATKRLPGDGVITGFGTINGNKVFVSSQDFTVIGGTLGKAHAKKICHVLRMAIKSRCPFICINDSGGARIEEGVNSLDGYSEIFYLNTKASGLIPQISVVLGPCAGGACYSPAISDFIFMSRRTSQMFITGPNVVKTVTGEDIDVQQLGGADIHAEVSGVTHFVYDNDIDCLTGVRKLVGYLSNSPKSYSDTFKSNSNSECSIQDIVPDNQKRSYDVKEVINEIVDYGSFFEVQKNFAQNIVIGFSKLGGRTIGIVANQPKHMSGCLDLNASDKAARFVRFCDCFNIPLVTLVDVPGFLPGSYQEHSGIIRHGAKLLYAYSEATVPKVSIIMRKAYGGAYIAMNSKNIGADMVYAWPIAQIAVMGAESAVEIIYKKEINKSDNPTLRRSDLIQEYNEQFMNPYIAAKQGYINEVIMPEETRGRLISCLSVLETKVTDEYFTKKHGNIPL